MDEQRIYESLSALDLPLREKLSKKDIKHNYKRLIKIYRPDVAPDAYKDGKKYQQIQEAYSFLSENIGPINYFFEYGQFPAVEEVNQPATETAKTTVKQRKKEKASHKELTQNERLAIICLAVVGSIVLVSAVLTGTVEDFISFALLAVLFTAVATLLISVLALIFANLVADYNRTPVKLIFISAAFILISLVGLFYASTHFS